MKARSRTEGMQRNGQSYLSRPGWATDFTNLDHLLHANMSVSTPAFVVIAPTLFSLFSVIVLAQSLRQPSSQSALTR